MDFNEGGGGGVITLKKETSPIFLTHVSKELDKLLGNYDHILLLGDFNSFVCEKNMKDLFEAYDIEKLILEPTCFENASNPSSIDVMLTNRKNSFVESNFMFTDTTPNNFKDEIC